MYVWIKNIYAKFIYLWSRLKICFIYRKWIEHGQGAKNVFFIYFFTIRYFEQKQTVTEHNFSLLPENYIVANYEWYVHISRLTRCKNSD